jgi:hypothetical protein
MAEDTSLPAQQELATPAGLTLAASVAGAGLLGHLHGDPLGLRGRAIRLIGMTSAPDTSEAAFTQFTFRPFSAALRKVCVPISLSELKEGCRQRMVVLIAMVLGKSVHCDGLNCD